MGKPSKKFERQIAWYREAIEDFIAGLSPRKRGEALGQIAEGYLIDEQPPPGWEPRASKAQPLLEASKIVASALRYTNGPSLAECLALERAIADFEAPPLPKTKPKAPKKKAKIAVDHKRGIPVKATAFKSPSDPYGPEYVSDLGPRPGLVV